MVSVYSRAPSVFSRGSITSYTDDLWQTVITTSPRPKSKLGLLKPLRCFLFGCIEPKKLKITGLCYQIFILGIISDGFLQITVAGTAAAYKAGAVFQV